MNDAVAIRILVCDDHPITREGLALILDNQPDMSVVAQAGNGREAVALFRKHRPDIIILDVQMPIMSGAEATEALLREFPDSRIILFTTFDGDEDIHRGMHAGARAYLLKDAPRSEVLNAIRYMARSGVSWSMLPRDFPSSSTAYWWFRGSSAGSSSRRSTTWRS